MDPETKPYLDAFWLPNTPDRADGSAQFISGFSQPTNQDFVMGRVDHQLSDSDTLFVRFNFDSADRFVPGFSGMNTGELSTTESRFSTVEHTRIYSPQLIGKSHISFNRTLITATDPVLEGFGSIPQFTFSAADDVIGHIDIGGGYKDWGGRTFNPKKHAQNLWEFKEDFYYSAGNHSFKFGGMFERFQANVRSDFNVSGTFNFSSLEDFMLNDVAGFTVTEPGSDNIRGWRQNLFSFYLQDDFNVRPGLTLNLGLRYEAVSSPTEVNGKVASIRDWSRAQEGFGPSSGHFYTVKNTETDIGDPYFDNPSLANFAPRVGFAWDPFQDGKTAVRGGVGMFHDQILPHVHIFLGARVAPFFSVSDLSSGDALVREAGGIDFPNAFTTQTQLLGGVTPQVDLVQHFVDQPTVYKWSMDVQHEVARDTTVDLGYSGTRGTNLWRGALQFNTRPAIQKDGRRFVLIQEPFPNPNWGRMRVTKTDGTSIYHGLRASLTKRFSRGFQVQTSYTWSKVMDDSTSTFGSTDFGAADRRGYRGEKEYVLSSLDLRHSFYTNFVVDIPSGNLTGGAQKVLGGWSISSIVRLNSGLPFNLAGDTPRDGAFRERYVDGPSLNLISGGDQNPIREQNPDEYFDVEQFTWPGAVVGTVGSQSDPRGLAMGTVERNTTITPGVANVDLTFLKDTPLWGESNALEFRFELFNLFNRPNFGTPASNLFTNRGGRRSNAGQITRTRTTSRQIQLALRFVF